MAIEPYKPLFTFAVEPVSLVALVTGAEESPEGVGTVAEDVAGAHVALVDVRHVTALAAVAVVAVALRVQAGAVAAVPPRRVQAVICRIRRDILTLRDTDSTFKKSHFCISGRSQSSLIPGTNGSHHPTAERFSRRYFPHIGILKVCQFEPNSLVHFRLGLDSSEPW